MPLIKGKVDPKELTPALQDLVPYLILGGTNDEDGTGSMLISAKDAVGATLSQRFRIRTWISSSDFGVPVAQTDFSVNTTPGCLELAEIDANADYDGISSSAGQLAMTIDVATDRTVYVMAELDGRVYSGSVEITGN